MKRTLITIAAVAAVIGLGFAAPAAYAATTKPQYTAPQYTTIVFHSDTTVEVAHSASPYADFFGLRISKNRDMTQSFRYNSRDVGVNSHSVEGLEPGTKYYVQAFVINYNGTRLSPFSNKVSFTTDTEPPVEE